MKLQKVTKITILFLFILPFILNQIWYVGGPEWAYWVSRYLWYSEILVFGLLMSVIPQKTRIWMYDKDEWQEKSLIDKISFVVYGIFLMIIGISSLASSCSK